MTTKTVGSEVKQQEEAAPATQVIKELRDTNEVGIHNMLASSHEGHLHGHLGNLEGGESR